MEVVLDAAVDGRLSRSVPARRRLRSARAKAEHKGAAPVSAVWQRHSAAPMTRSSKPSPLTSPAAPTEWLQEAATAATTLDAEAVVAIEPPTLMTGAELVAPLEHHERGAA